MTTAPPFTPGPLTSNLALYLCFKRNFEQFATSNAGTCSAGMVCTQPRRKPLQHIDFYSHLATVSHRYFRRLIPPVTSSSVYFHDSAQDAMRPDPFGLPLIYSLKHEQTQCSLTWYSLYSHQSATLLRQSPTGFKVRRVTCS